MSGHVGDLSEKQTRALEKLKANTKDVRTNDHDDYYMLRWLRARDFDVQKAETMLREALKWRKEIGADTILETYKSPEVVIKYRTGGLLPTTDKYGCPILMDPYGMSDMAGLLKSCKKQDLVKRYVHFMETIAQRCKAETRKRGVQIDQILFIYDLKGFGLRHFHRPTVDIYLTLAKAAECRYPELLRKVFVINDNRKLCIIHMLLNIEKSGEQEKNILKTAPRLFSVAWKIVSPVLQEATRKKVGIYTDNYLEDLLKEVDPENLPAHYGGTLIDSNGDPRCSEWICYGGTVPEHYYNQPTARSDLTTVEIGRGSSLQLDFEIKQPTSLIKYEFYTDDCDIGFGIFRKTTGERQKAGEMEPVLTSERVNSHMVPEDGAVECTESGTYVVRFDNTYSWTRSKTVHYSIEVLEPSKDELPMDEPIVWRDDNTFSIRL